MKEGTKSLLQTSLLQLSERKGVSERSRQVIASFLQLSDPIQSLLQDEEEFQDADGQPAYSASSGGVVDMVKKMGEKFEAELEEAEKREVNMQHNFDMMKR